MSQPLDYKELLKKYMSEVIDWEGVSFINYVGAVDYSAEELDELRRIESEIEK